MHGPLLGIVALLALKGFAIWRVRNNQDLDLLLILLINPCHHSFAMESPELERRSVDPSNPKKGPNPNRDYKQHFIRQKQRYDAASTVC